jgi:V8-like Glu-specific endopeptidase
MRDGAVQWFDAVSLNDYRHVSAFFNGDRVRVEILCAPGTSGNRALVTKVRTGDVQSQTETICGPTDTRVLSSDPRVGRIDGCCTAFLVDERTLCTAGHCIGGIGGQLVHFNVPLSDAAGNAQYPPPDDQYALLPGSLTSVNGGLGNDYAVMSAVRNSNTGLYPGEAQGSWLEAAVQPPAPTATWTVTGFGSSNVNPTWSLAQKSHTGPRTVNNPSVLQFRIHVSGCNSGSPVIGASGTQVHGVVTHAGCTPTDGANYGTGFGFAPFLQAVQALQQTRVAGTFASFGTGCGGATGIPVLAQSGVPDLGGSVTYTVTNLDPGADRGGLLMLGVSDTVWNGAPLPADMAVVNMPGCLLLVAPLLNHWLTTNFGTTAMTLPIPNLPEFLSVRFYGQYFAHDPTAPNLAEVVATNAGRMKIGN